MSNLAVHLIAHKCKLYNRFDTQQFKTSRASNVPGDKIFHV